MHKTLLETKCETKEEEWLAQVDDFRTFLGDFASSVTHLEYKYALNLVLA